MTIKKTFGYCRNCEWWDLWADVIGYCDRAKMDDSLIKPDPRNYICRGDDIEMVTIQTHANFGCVHFGERTG